MPTHFSGLVAFQMIEGACMNMLGILGSLRNHLVRNFRDFFLFTNFHIRPFDFD
jgi:hypothetical protein